MAQQRSLNHFTLLKFRPAYWQLDPTAREGLLQQVVDALAEVAPRRYLYQVFPSRHEADLLLWCALPYEDTESPARFFTGFAQAFVPLYPYVDVPLTLWGVTKPSIYAKGRSPQEIDPFAVSRKRYLVVYPFVKTADWYLMSRDARQGMMNEHIRVGRQYPEILQLLLYSFGVQDQEFVVVYETDDIVQFSDLVQDLRSTEARKFTLRDTPIITAVGRQQSAEGSGQTAVGSQQ